MLMHRGRRRPRCWGEEACVEAEERANAEAAPGDIASVAMPPPSIVDQATMQPEGE